MATTNVTLTQFFSDFGKFQTDASTYFTNQAAANAKILAFLQTLSSGSTGTQLSAADQATLNSLDNETQALDAQAEALNTAIGSINLPTPPATGTSGS